MAKFKVGDKVRVVYVNDLDTYSVGDEGKVVDTHPLGVVLVEFVDGLDEWAVEEQVELISEDNKNWWETPEGIEWLSTQQDVEEQFLKSQEKKEERTYHIGQRFVVTCGSTEWNCILAQVGADVVCLIDLESGNRIYEPISVVNSRKITEDEMKMIAEDCSFHLL